MITHCSSLSPSGLEASPLGHFDKASGVIFFLWFVTKNFTTQLFGQKRFKYLLVSYHEIMLTSCKIFTKIKALLRNGIYQRHLSTRIYWLLVSLFAWLRKRLREAAREKISQTNFHIWHLELVKKRKTSVRTNHKMSLSKAFK